MRNARRRSRDSISGPEFQQELKDREVLEGDTIHFDVRISGRPEPKVTWTKDGKDLVESSQITFVSDPETGLYSLLIKKASIDDEGDYRVVASNSGGSISCQAELLVEGTYEICKRFKPLESFNTSVSQLNGSYFSDRSRNRRR
jgi:hypothetical protein